MYRRFEHLKVSYRHYIATYVYPELMFIPNE